MNIINVIDEALHQASLEGLPIVFEASTWTPSQKKEWYESLFLSDELIESQIDDNIELGYHTHNTRL